MSPCLGRAVARPPTSPALLSPPCPRVSGVLSRAPQLAPLSPGSRSHTAARGKQIECEWWNREHTGAYPGTPPFGKANSSTNEVLAFYGHWCSFVSIRSFAECDRYGKTSSAPCTTTTVTTIFSSLNHAYSLAVRSAVGSLVRACFAHPWP